MKKWRRYRFYIPFTENFAPAMQNNKYPWWKSGYAEGFLVIVAYLPANEDLRHYWEKAFNVEYIEQEQIEFTSRFSRPDYFEQS